MIETAVDAAEEFEDGVLDVCKHVPDTSEVHPHVVKSRGARQAAMHDEGNAQHDEESDQYGQSR